MGSNQTKAMLLAADNGDIKQVKRLLEHVNVNSYDPKTLRTALQFASFRGHKEMVDLLLQSGADTKNRDKTGKSALHYAVQERHKSIVQALIDSGAELSGDTSGSSPLHVASSIGDVGLLWLLLRNALTVGGKNKNEQNPLHLAVKNGHLECAALLLLRGDSDIMDEKDSNGLRPLDHGRKEGHAQCCCLLDYSSALFKAIDLRIPDGQLPPTVGHVLGGACSLLSSPLPAVRLWAVTALSRLSDICISQFGGSVSFIIRALDSCNYFGFDVEDENDTPKSTKSKKDHISIAETKKHGILDIELAENLLHILVKVAEYGPQAIRKQIVKEMDWEVVMKLALSNPVAISVPARRLLTAVGLSLSDMVVKILKAGDMLVKIRRRAGGVHERLFKLVQGKNSLEIQWESENKRASQSRLELDKVKEIRLGQRTVPFRKNMKQLTQLRLKSLDPTLNAQQSKNLFSFSLIYTDSKNKEQSLDLVCANEYQYSLWIAALEGCIGEKAMDQKAESVSSDKGKEEANLYPDSEQSTAMSAPEEHPNLYPSIPDSEQSTATDNITPIQVTEAPVSIPLPEKPVIDPSALQSQMQSVLSSLQDHTASSERRLDNQSRQARVLVAAGREDEARLCLRYVRFLRSELNQSAKLSVSLMDSNTKLESPVSKGIVDDVEDLLQKVQSFIEEMDNGPSLPPTDLAAEKEISAELKSMTDRVDAERASMRHRNIVDKQDRSSSLPPLNTVPTDPHVPPKPRYLIGVKPRTVSPLAKPDRRGTLPDAHRIPEKKKEVESPEPVVEEVVVALVSEATPEQEVKAEVSDQTNTEVTVEQTDQDNISQSISIVEEEKANKVLESPFSWPGANAEEALKDSNVSPVENEPEVDVGLIEAVIAQAPSVPLDPPIVTEKPVSKREAVLLS